MIQSICHQWHKIESNKTEIEIPHPHTLMSDTDSQCNLTACSGIMMSLVEGMKTLTETIKELKAEIRDLRDEMEDLKESGLGGGGARIKTPLELRYEAFLKTLNGRQKSTLRQQLRYYTAGVQRPPVSKEEAYEIIITKLGVNKEEFERELDAGSITSCETKSAWSSSTAASVVSTSTAESITPPKRYLPTSLLNYRHMKLLNDSFRPTFTYAEFISSIKLELHHADMMLQNTYSDGMAKVIYDVIKLQMVAHESSASPWVTVGFMNPNGKTTSISYHFVSEEEGWKPLSSKNIDDCFNIFTKEMMYLSNQWRRKQMEEDTSPDVLERAMTSMAHMNHIGRGNNTSLEGERKKILAILVDLLEMKV